MAAFLGAFGGLGDGGSAGIQGLATGDGGLGGGLGPGDVGLVGGLGTGTGNFGETGGLGSLSLGDNSKKGQYEYDMDRIAISIVNYVYHSIKYMKSVNNSLTKRDALLKLLLTPGHLMTSEAMKSPKALFAVILVINDIANHASDEDEPDAAPGQFTRAGQGLLFSFMQQFMPKYLNNQKWHELCDKQIVNAQDPATLKRCLVYFIACVNMCMLLMVSSVNGHLSGEMTKYWDDQDYKMPILVFSENVKQWLSLITYMIKRFVYLLLLKTDINATLTPLVVGKALIFSGNCCTELLSFISSKNGQLSFIQAEVIILQVFANKPKTKELVNAYLNISKVNQAHTNANVIQKVEFTPKEYAVLLHSELKPEKFYKWHTTLEGVLTAKKGFSGAHFGGFGAGTGGLGGGGNAGIQGLGGGLETGDSGLIIGGGPGGFGSLGGGDAGLVAGGGAFGGFGGAGGLGGGGNAGIQGLAGGFVGSGKSNKGKMANYTKTLFQKQGGL